MNCTALLNAVPAFLLKNNMTFIKKFSIVIFLLLLSAPLVSGQTVKYELKKVSFSGNSAITSLNLSEICFSKESPGWFSQFLNSFSFLGSKVVYYDSSKVPLDTKLIKNLYVSSGYWNAKVASSVILNAKEKTAELLFSISEGKPFKFKSFKISGLERLPVDLQSQLQGNIEVDTSEIYSKKLVISKKEYVRSFLNDNGYMDASDPEPEVLVDTLHNTTEVKIDFLTGNRFKISEIKVEKSGAGKDLIDDDLIIKICGLKPDTYFSQFETRKAYLRLYRTDLFDSLALNRGYSENNSNLVPLEIIGKTTALHELSPELIGNNEDDELNLGIALSFIKKNFLGDARKMSVTATAATKNFTQIGYTDLRVAFDQPYLFGSQIRPRIEGYFTNQLWRTKYDAIFYGAKLNLDFESDLTPYTFLTSLSAYINWEYSRFSFEKTYLIEQLKSLDSASLRLLNIGDRTIFSGDNATIGLLLTRDKTNRLSFPTEGISMSLLLEDGNSFLFLLNKIFNKVFNRPLYLKSVFSFANYYPLWDKNMTAFAYKLKAGSIFSYRGDKLDIPINNRFYGGGSNSIRGWKSRDLVPQIPAFVGGPNTTNDDIEAFIKKVSPGGFLLFEGSFEARTKWSENFGTAVFLDYGNTWNDLKDISFKSIAISTGLGFRLYTSLIPPLRLDFGFKLYDPYKQRLDVNKTIGDLFKENFEIQFGIGEAF